MNTQRSDNIFKHKLCDNNICFVVSYLIVLVFVVGILSIITNRYKKRPSLHEEPYIPKEHLLHCKPGSEQYQQCNIRYYDMLRNCDKTINVAMKGHCESWDVLMETLEQTSDINDYDAFRIVLMNIIMMTPTENRIIWGKLQKIANEAYSKITFENREQIVYIFAKDVADIEWPPSLAFNVEVWEKLKKIATNIRNAYMDEILYPYTLRNKIKVEL